MNLRCLILLPALLLFLSCHGIVSPGWGGIPSVVGVYVDTTSAKPVIRASVSEAGAVSESGFYVSRNGSEDRLVVSIDDDGEMVLELSDVPPGSDVSLCAFLTNGLSEIRSGELSFTVPKGHVVTPLEPVDAVEIEDQALKAYVMWYFDDDRDGLLSQEEAEEIHVVEYTDAALVSARGIEYFPRLEKLYLSAGGAAGDKVGKGLMKSVDLSHNAELRELYVMYMQLTSLDLSHNPELRWCSLDCSRIARLDLSANTKLEFLALCYNRLTSLDLSALTQLAEAHLEGNGLETIQLGTKEHLWYLDCHDNHLKTLDLSGCRKLEALGCDGNPGLVVRLAKGQVIASVSADPDVRYEYVD